MIELKDFWNIKWSSNAITRWAKYGPYYAMFPIDFAFNVIDKHSNIWDNVLDPFAWRFSSIYASAILWRNATWIEINPLWWIYWQTKLNPCIKDIILIRLEEIYALRFKFQSQANDMWEFYKLCYCNEVLTFLLSARANLGWKDSHIDRTLMSFILIYLHWKLWEGLSNQMRLTKSMGMNYSINWWKSNNYLVPPEINPLKLIQKKIEWRYLKWVPEASGEFELFLGDSVDILKNIKEEKLNKYSLLFTSPPYCSIVDYHVDQWIRLWMLWWNDSPKTNKDKHKWRFNWKEEYKELLNDVFGESKYLMKSKSTIYVRTDIREFTFNTTLEVLKKHFPTHKLTIIDQPFLNRTQTELFNQNITQFKKRWEIDIILES
ncbi:MAG: hypothetical protein ACD_3C00033G0005 [uncultured bacterium (gcode 4)]|uniref:site-specific DNA-methyltransferase (cytosine-N(4)-specific) n=1 Tax=uncultured bacterium (gcode 4) TaxID=1234023 RepID=K2G327_9BACT|nr:MAG: hypothetical protein ACD_3C00033G0005 [uncultured bacterium (gcode 4)]